VNEVDGKKYRSTLDLFRAIELSKNVGLCLNEHFTFFQGGVALARRDFEFDQGDFPPCY
jgi:hypothetical protein